MPDSVGVYYSNSSTEAVTAFNGVDTDAAQDGEFLTTPSGKWWCQRQPGADEINVYLKNPQGQWVYSGTMSPPSSAGSTSGFGTAVISFEGRLYVGAPSALNASSVAAGAVYVYDTSGTSFNLVETIELPDGAAGDRFGASLAGDGNRLVVGAPLREKVDGSTTIQDAGAAFLYERTSSWSLLRTEWSSVAQENGQFGFSVGLKARIIAIGAPYEDGWFWVGNDIYVMGDTGTVHVGRWDKPNQLLGFYNLFSLFGAVQQNILGLGESHFGWSVAVDDLMRIVVSMPDSTWTPQDNMTGWDSGLVMLMNWNGSVDQDYSFNITAFSHGDLSAGDRFGEYLETAEGGVDFGVSTALRVSNAPVHYFAVTAVQTQPGQVIGGIETPLRAGVMTGMDIENDMLNFTVPSLENPYASHFEIAGSGEFQALSSLETLANGVHSIGLSVGDGEWTLRRNLSIEILGASPDADGDSLPDWWESSHNLDVYTADADNDPDGDALTNLQEFQQGSDPNDYFKQGNTVIIPQLEIISGNQQRGPPSEFLAEP
ncbi:MAG: FG-GAP repeat protein, partial [Verrucomicrobium sp.]